MLIQWPTLLASLAFSQMLAPCLEARVIQDAPPASAPEERSDAPVRDAKADAVLERSLKAMGGKTTRDQIVSSRSNATLSMGERTTEFQLLARGKTKFIVRHMIKGLGQMEIGFDGQNGWRSDPPDQKITPISEQEAAEFRRTFDFQAMLRELDRRFPSARIQPEEMIESVACDVLILEKPEERLKVYFDQNTGLIKAFEIISDQDRRRRRVVIESWSNEARPLRWAKKLRIEQPRTTLEATYSSVTFDDVADATFEAPPDVVRTEGVRSE